MEGVFEVCENKGYTCKNVTFCHVLKYAPYLLDCQVSENVQSGVYTG